MASRSYSYMICMILATERSSVHTIIKEYDTSPHMSPTRRNREEELTLP